jgi:hypothetical protein
MFGSKLRMPMRQMLAPDMEDTPGAYPGMSTSAPAPSKPGMFGGKYGGPQLNKWQVIGATLQQMGNNQGQLGDLYDREDKRQRGAFDQQREEAMLAALAESQAIPEQLRPFLPYAPQAVLSGVVGNALKPPPPPEYSYSDGVVLNKGTGETRTVGTGQPSKTWVVGKTLLGMGPDGRPRVLYQDPDKVGADGKPSLSEARQWANSYNDDVDGYNKDLGILRPALPYAQKVVRSNGDPGGNFRMDDVALLRAAARAQTGPGVLMESEVYGTLSPSLRQKLQSGVAYVDVAKGSITPEDRLALAQYVMQGGSQTAGDVWRRYDSTTKPLQMRGVEPESVGVLGPEMIHPDDMPSFLQQPLENFQTGKGYTGPSGRRYIYRGQGRFQYANENAYDPSLAIGQNKPAPTPGLPPGVVVRRK